VNWEYKVSNAPTTPRELQTILDRDGMEQWELVSATLVASRLLLLLKRPFAYVEGTETTQEAVSLQEPPMAEEAPFSETGEEQVS
jgi:hypothetical protein